MFIVSPETFSDFSGYIRLPRLVSTVGQLTQGSWLRFASWFTLLGSVAFTVAAVPPMAPWSGKNPAPGKVGKKEKKTNLRMIKWVYLEINLQNLGSRIEGWWTIHFWEGSQWVDPYPSDETCIERTRHSSAHEINQLLHDAQLDEKCHLVSRGKVGLKTSERWCLQFAQMH